ncbi:uncharacterized protein CG4449 [Anopheles moucheti]|uniref:uncharacterized protein CG4449 n=1 Tax=Anopheles moucheti TaxID=186751 RepID=UPI0022EFEAD2|nr:uncharacterized protein CG4449 [Anopheles moucheti]
MSDIFENLDSFLDNYDENNISSNSILFNAERDSNANDSLGNDYSRGLSTSSAGKNNNKIVKDRSRGRKSQTNRDKSARTSTATSATTSNVPVSSTPAPAPSVFDLTAMTLLSAAEDMQLLLRLFDSIFNSKNPLVKELVKDREAMLTKRSFTTLNNSYNKKPPVTASELLKVKQKIDAVRTKLTQLDQRIKNVLQPVSLDQPSPGSRRTRNSTRRNQASAPVVITLDSDDDSMPEFVGQVNNPSKANNSFETENYVMRIKVRWGMGIEMFEHRRFQKFADMFAQLAAKESADSSCIFLNLEDRIVYPNDTPDSINYKPNQFISGRILKSKAPGLPTASALTTSNNSTISLKIQMETRKQPLRIQIDKQQTMSVLVIKCAEELKCKPKDIKLYFDGELIDNSSKPEDLDLEGDEILDIRFTK